MINGCLFGIHLLKWWLRGYYFHKYIAGLFRRFNIDKRDDGEDLNCEHDGTELTSANGILSVKNMYKSGVMRNSRRFCVRRLFEKIEILVVVKRCHVQK